MRFGYVRHEKHRGHAEYKRVQGVSPPELVRMGRVRETAVYR